ncbi:hypothetical protein STEG23_021073, partial [Scotinomys teguina]
MSNNIRILSRKWGTELSPDFGDSQPTRDSNPSVTIGCTIQDLYVCSQLFTQMNDLNGKREEIFSFILVIRYKNSPFQNGTDSSSLLLCLPPCVLRLTGNFYILSSWRAGVFSSCCLALDSSSSFPCPAFRAITKSGPQAKNNARLLKCPHIFAGTKNTNPGARVVTVSRA